MYGHADWNRCMPGVSKGEGGLHLNGREQSVQRQIARGMDVCDVSGEKVGTVAQVHSEVVEVKTGPFGLGKHLFVPPSAVDDVTEACVVLRHAKHEFHAVGLDARPEHLTN
jgi:hypothetical protein